MASVSVDKDKCIGCGACVSMCPDVFEMNEDHKSVVKNNDCEKCDCNAAASACPVGAINVTE